MGPATLIGTCIGCFMGVLMDVGGDKLARREGTLHTNVLHNAATFFIDRVIVSTAFSLVLCRHESGAVNNIIFCG